MKQFEFACGGVTIGIPGPEIHRLALDVQGEKNVNLRISDISRSMVSNIPDLLLDLLEVAAYIYCADQRASRGSDKLTLAGSSWPRGMRFVIPVRHPEIWSSALVSAPLHETLGFLSDDTYEIVFVPAAAPLSQPEDYFPELADDTPLIDEVALFSGGIDSFAGVVDTIVGGRKKTLLVGHHSAPKVFSVQKELVGHLKQAGCGNDLFYVPVNITNTGVHPVETTQRSRSFLFASLAFVLARMFGKESFTFFENGVVSLNIPIAADVLGARATRTTHPRVIRGFEEIFSALAERPIEIRTPYIWFTKKEVVQRILQNGFGHLLSRTVSCTRPRSWTREVRHCGACSQCIDRRFAILAAGGGELEPASDYVIDLLLGDRSLDEDVRMAVAYVKFCQAAATCCREQFLAQFPQVASVLSYMPGLSTDEVLELAWNLHQRHAEDVLSVIEAGLQNHRSRIARGAIPPGSLLSLSFSRNRIEPPPLVSYDKQVEEFMDRLEQPVAEFAVDAEAERIWFRGGFYLEGPSYKLVNALLDNHRTGKARAAEIPFIETWKLAQDLGTTEVLLRQQITRTRKQVAERLAVDQGIALGTDDFIENRRIEGYRLSPDFRELLQADLEGGERPVTNKTANVTNSDTQG